MRIGILTGGGDVPGLNPCIKSVVYLAADAGAEVYGFRRGWAGLLNFNADDKESQHKWVMPLTKQNTRTIDRSGGTFIHTSRTNPGKVRWSDIPKFLQDPKRPPKDGDPISDFTPHILRNLEHLKIDVLITIGGDDTQSYGVRLHQEGFPVVAIPKTMDNDVFGTDYCIGFSTAVTRSVEFITNLRTSAGSHERIAVIELFGRNSGETSLISAYLAGVDRAIISEVHFDPEKLAKFLMDDKRNNPSNYAIMTISEGAQMTAGKIVEYRRAGCVWTQEARRDRTNHRRSNSEDHRVPHHLPASRIFDEERRAGRARSNGRDQLREPGDRSCIKEENRKHGRVA